jgi:two-component system, cell cycle sensor histidine kinase and response regulator CckA
MSKSALGVCAGFSRFECFSDRGHWYLNHLAKGPDTLLNSSEKMVRALLESASQGIIGIDRTGRLVLANPKALEMFGYSSEELMGAQVEMLLPESKRHAHIQQRNDYVHHPRTRPMGIGMELAGRRKDGREFPVEVSLSYVETDEGLFVIAFVNDISQRKLLEEQLLQSQKMEAVGRLAGGVAHDFNNMLTVIQGYNRMMLDELSPVDPLRDYAEEITRAADRAGALTNQLLAFSRRQIIQPRVMNVNVVVENTEKMLRRLIGEDIDLLINLGAEIGNIKADPSHIEQAIVNLVVNARDAMPQGGRINIETANVILDETYSRSHMGVQPGQFIMIAVSDTGHGMDAETKRRMFEPFFTTKSHGKGTGLGLATVYGTVKQMNGDIWVYSEPGQGTTLKMYFPRVAEAAGGAGEQDVIPPRAEAGETILVVEDEKSVRDLTVRILTKLGYKVLVASGGEEAIAISDSYPDVISLLLTDVVMPNMSGRQVADHLLAARHGLKILYLSGYTDTTVVHHGVLENGLDFLPKPFSREVLARKIREVLGR